MRQFIIVKQSHVYRYLNLSHREDPLLVDLVMQQTCEGASTTKFKFSTRVQL